MRTSEPTLNVSQASSNVSEAGVNFTVDNALSREESVYRTKIRKGFRKGIGWGFAVAVEGQPFYGDFETVAVAAEREWARIQSEHGTEIARDFALCDAIDAAETQRNVYWPSRQV